jgi:hypothetical protein
MAVEMQNSLSNKLLHRVKINGKWGYIDGRARLAILPCYGDAFPFNEGHAVVRREPWGAKGFPPPFSVVNDRGEIIIDQSDALPDTDGFADGLLRVSSVRDGYSAFFLNKAGSRRFEGRFESVNPFRDKRASVRIGTLTGFIDPSGEVVIAPRFHCAPGFTGGYAMVWEPCGKKIGIIDTQGDYLLEPTPELQFGTLSEGVAVARSHKGFHYVDLHGKPLFAGLYFQHGPSRLITPPDFVECLSSFFRHGPKVLFNRGMATTHRRGPSGFHDGMAAYSQSEQGLIGFINLAGERFEPHYSKILADFSEGLCAVELPDGRKAYIDKKCDEVIDISNCTYAGEFKNGLAAVWIGAKLGYINCFGEHVWEPRG